MDSRFSDLTSSLPASLQRLLDMVPVSTESLPRKMPSSGIYLLSEGPRHLYVGRSNRIRSRIRQHGAENSKHNVAAFAFKIAREATGRTVASYRREASRRSLAEDPEFAKAFQDSKARVRRMEVRYVEEQDQLKQTLLEIYTAVVLQTPYNDFDTH